MKYRSLYRITLEFYVDSKERERESQGHLYVYGIKKGLPANDVEIRDMTPAEMRTTIDVAKEILAGDDFEQSWIRCLLKGGVVGSD